MPAFLASLWSNVKIPPNHKKKGCDEYVTAYQTTQDQEFIIWLLAKEDENGRLSSTLYSILKNVADASDVAQDIFLSLRESLLNNRRLDNCSAWLRQVVRNKAIDFKNRLSVRRDKEKKAAWQGKTEDSLDLVQLKVDAEKVLPLMKADIAGIQMGWEIIILKNLRKSFTECARQLGLTFTQFRGRYQRADKILKNNYGADYQKFLIWTPEFQAKQ